MADNKRKHDDSQMADNKRKHDDSQAPPSSRPTGVSAPVSSLSPADGFSAGQQTVSYCSLPPLPMDGIQLAKEKALEIAIKKPRVEDCIDGGETIKYPLLQPCSKILTKDADPNSPEPEQISKAEQESTYGPGVGAESQDCAACLHEKKSCPFGCPLAPFFPRNRMKDFMNCDEVYGVEKLKHLINKVEESEKEGTVNSLVHDATAIILTLQIKHLEKLASFHELKCTELNLRSQLLREQARMPGKRLLFSPVEQQLFPTDEQLFFPIEEELLFSTEELINIYGQVHEDEELVGV